MRKSVSKYLIFDLDNTLCDFNCAERKAREVISSLLNENNIDSFKFWKRYKNIEPILYKEFSLGKITVDEYRIRRYSDVLVSMNYTKNIDLSEKFNELFMYQINNKIELFDDVIPTILQLQKHDVILAILTNGPSDGQRQKIVTTGLDKYFPYIFIGEEIGFFKPKKEAFEYVLNCFRCTPEEMIMIGDSLVDDILGPKQLGICTILIDRNNLYKKNKIRPNYIINNLSDLTELLENI